MKLNFKKMIKAATAAYVFYKANEETVDQVISVAKKQIKKRTKKDLDKPIM
jgi:hypothetical protein